MNRPKKKEVKLNYLSVIISIIKVAIIIYIHLQRKIYHFLNDMIKVVLEIFYVEET